MIRVGRGVTLLVGGARSGKSDLAVRLGEAWDGEVVFVATATAGDDDMGSRIERHRQERPSDWSVVELPRCEPAGLVAADPDALAIVDCVTMLVANLMFDELDEAAILDHIDDVLDVLGSRAGPTLAVSNEVGPFATRYLRVHPTAYNSHIAMRLNVTACVYYAAGTYTLVQHPTLYRTCVRLEHEYTIALKSKNLKYRIFHCLLPIN